MAEQRHQPAQQGPAQHGFPCRPAEGRAPETARAHEDQTAVGHGLQQPERAAVAAQMGAAVPGQAPGGIQKDVLAPGQRGGAAVQRLPHPVTGGEAVTAQVRQGDAARQRGQRPQPWTAYLMAVRQRPQVESGELRTQEGRIHEGGMVGQDKHPPAPLACPFRFGLQDVQPFQADTVAQGQQGAAAGQQHAGEQDADTAPGPVRAPGPSSLPLAAPCPAVVSAVAAIRNSVPETAGQKDGPDQGKAAQQHVGRGGRQEGQQGVDRPGQGHAGKGKEIGGR